MNPLSGPDAVNIGAADAARVHDGAALSRRSFLAGATVVTAAGFFVLSHPGAAGAETTDSPAAAESVSSDSAPSGPVISLAPAEPFAHQIPAFSAYFLR